jgi:hypothetical protein
MVDTKKEKENFCQAQHNIRRDDDDNGKFGWAIKNMCFRRIWQKRNTNVYALCVLSGSGHKNGNVQILCLYVQGLVAEREKVVVQGITIKYQFV